MAGSNLVTFLKIATTPFGEALSIPRKTLESFYVYAFGCAVGVMPERHWCHKTEPESIKISVFLAFFLRILQPYVSKCS